MKQSTGGSVARAVAAAALAMAIMSSAWAGALRVVTEDYPPYSYLEDGRVVGFSTAVVRAVLAEAGLEEDIQLMPWARAYDLALHGEQVMIYSIARTPSREHKFKWIGQVAPSEWFLYSLGGHALGLKSLDDARKYTIGTVNQDVGEQFLVEHGFDPKRNLQSSNKYEHNYEKLKLGRVDLWIANAFVAEYLARRAGDDPAQRLHPELQLHELGGDGLYMAFSRNTPDELVERCRRALASVRRNGRLDAIRQSWR